MARKPQRAYLFNQRMDPMEKMDPESHEWGYVGRKFLAAKLWAPTAAGPFIAAHLKTLTDYPPSQGADTLSLKKALENAQDMMERPNRAGNYGGKLDVEVKTALGKWLWDNSSVDAHVELRYGDTPLFNGGTLIPTSTALIFPESEGTHAKLSGLYFTQLFGGRYVVQAGRFNTLDLYSAHPFTGGEGVDRFMNLSLVAPPVSARTVPPVAEGALFSLLRGTTPMGTLGVIESTEEGFFENGATFLWTVSPPLKFSSKPGGISFGGEISSFEGTSLDQSPFALLPESPIPLAEEEGTWTLNVTVDQFLGIHPADPTKGWGFFGMVGVSDGNPSFLELQAFAGLGGAAPFESRRLDTWGVGYFFNGVSSDLRNTLDPFIRTDDEQGLEVFYSWAPVGWSRITAVLQVIDRSLSGPTRARSSPFDGK